MLDFYLNSNGLEPAKTRSDCRFLSEETSSLCLSPRHSFYESGGLAVQSLDERFLSMLVEVLEIHKINFPQ